MLSDGVRGGREAREMSGAGSEPPEDCGGKKRHLPGTRLSSPGVQSLPSVHCDRSSGSCKTLGPLLSARHTPGFLRGPFLSPSLQAGPAYTSGNQHSAEEQGIPTGSSPGLGQECSRVETVGLAGPDPTHPAPRLHGPATPSHGSEPSHFPSSPFSPRDST